MTRLTTGRLQRMLHTLALAATLAAQPDSLRPDADVRLAALRHASDVRHCYEREGLTRDPRLAGTMEVAVTILPTGVVRDAKVTAHEMRGLGTREVGLCLTRAIRNWRFSRGPFGVETVVFPFRFTPERTSEPRVVGTG